MRDHVRIWCSTHCKWFWQQAGPHSLGHGCPDCGRDVHKYSSQEYFEVANRKHGYKFDYSESVYKGSNQQITFKCPIHGYVTMNAGKHVKSKSGCRLCANLNRFGGYCEGTFARDENKRK